MYEIEIKSLLGSRDRADELKRRLVRLFPALRTLPPHRQRNHYFKMASPAFDFGKSKAGDCDTTNVAHANDKPKELNTVQRVIAPLLPEEKRAELARIIQNVKGEVSIRTREADGKTFFILKASIGDDTSANGVSRVEFECVITPVRDGRDCCTIRPRRTAHANPVRRQASNGTNKSEAQRPKTLEELDKILLDAGLTYQAKWSREREHFDLGSIHITIDKNAGYGFLAEFEKMIATPLEATGHALPLTGQVTEAKRELKALMAELNCQELSQERLERMFRFYNEHWKDYYGTEKVFVIE